MTTKITLPRAKLAKSEYGSYKGQWFYGRTRVPKALTKHLNEFVVVGRHLYRLERTTPVAKPMLLKDAAEKFGATCPLGRALAQSQQKIEFKQVKASDKDKAEYSALKSRLNTWCQQQDWKRFEQNIADARKTVSFYAKLVAYNNTKLNQATKKLQDMEYIQRKIVEGNFYHQGTMFPDDTK